MATTPKRAAVIGIDCGMPALIEKHIAGGHLPTFKKLIEGGVIADYCLPVFPTITPPGWTSLATGATPGSHGVTDFWMPLPGETPENANTVEGFNSDWVQAEFIWEAADKAGKRCVVLNYPVSWPPRLTNGVVVGGAGLSVGERRTNRATDHPVCTVCDSQLITNGIYPNTVRGEFVAAEGWANLPEPGKEPLEMAAALIFPHAAEPLSPTTWYLLARQSAGDGYDTVTLGPSKDCALAFCTLRVGEWSPKIVASVTTREGGKKDVSFRCKLIELSPDAEDIRLFLTALVDVKPWCYPAEAAALIDSPEGVQTPNAGLVEYSLGLIDKDTYVECCEFYTRWLTDAAAGLLKDRDWDLFFMHCHPTDWTYHLLLEQLDPNLTPDASKVAEAWEVDRRVYEAQDAMIARIVELAGDDSLIALVSDHGASMDGLPVDMYRLLGSAGLATLQGKPRETEGDSVYARMELSLGIRRRPVPGQSKAIPQRACYVYVNLKGRDPEGIVEPEDYEKVQQEIIDALLTYRDPKTGQRPVALALTRRDARLLGLHGEKIGDVVYALYPQFGIQHGPILPTAGLGIGDLRTLFVLNGPGIKKAARLERTIRSWDLVPTLCYLLNLPVPEQTEGAVIYQVFADPNFRVEESRRLREGLARMEEALGARQ